MIKRRIIIVFVFVILLITSLLIGVDQRVTFLNLITFDQTTWRIFLLSRLPRTIVIILCATGLSIAGMIMHALGRNKFISPSTSGATDAALLGILLYYLLIPGQSTLVKFIFSFTFAMLATVLLLVITNRVKFKSSIYIPLIGMMIASVIGAMTTLLAQRFQLLQVLNQLRVGSFAHINIINAQLLWVLVPALVMGILYAEKFNIIALGIDFSKNLGVNYKLVMMMGLLIVSTISASTYIVVGPLPFLGLVVPNLLSIYLGDNLKKNMMDVALFGSSFVLLNDIIARLVRFPGETSISFIMGISGAIIFFYLIAQKVKSA